jgi:HAD superfamily hydrolase (TIGR01490 family)
MAIAAFFDLDDTLVKGNSGIRCSADLFLRGRISLYHTLRSVYRYAYYYIGKSDPEAFFHDIYFFMRGRDQSEERRRFARFYDLKVRPCIFKDAIRRVEWHRKQGHMIVIVTNSLEDMIWPIKEDIGADELIASRLEQKAGKYTGLTSVVCFGKNKELLIRRLAARRSINLKNSYAYSDNNSDVAMLSAVGNPCAVNPQARMRKAALSKGWKIVRWR